MLSNKDTATNTQESFPEIHLIDVISFFRRNAILICLSVLVSTFLGFLFSYTATKLYTAKTILLPEYSTNKSSFFSLAMGTNSSEGTGNLTPELYPNILSTTAFGEFLVKQPVTTVDGKKHQSLRDYMTPSQQESFLGKIRSFFFSKKNENKSTTSIVKLDDKNILNYSSKDQSIIASATGMVKASIEQRNGLISIESELPDPVIAAILVESAKNYLVDYVEDFRTAKLNQQLSFLTSRVKEAQARQRQAEYALQSYRDRNRNAFLNVARIEEQRLQADYTLSQSIYTDLSIKQEQIKIRVKEERPVFKVLEPTKVPLDRTSPKRIYYALTTGIIGLFLSLFYIVIFKEKLLKNLVN